MEITIRGDKLKVTDAISEYAEKKLDRIDKYYEKASAEVTVSLLLKLIMMNGLFIAIIYSFIMMSVMLVLGQVKNSF